MNSLMCAFLVIAMVPPTKAGADAAQKSAGDSAINAVEYKLGAAKYREFQTTRIAAAYANYLAVKNNLSETDAFFLGLSFTKLDTQVASCDGYIVSGDGCIVRKKQNNEIEREPAMLNLLETKWHYCGDVNLEHGGLFVDLSDWQWGY